MGTSTLFRRHNDLGWRLADMPKKDLDRIDRLRPWGENRDTVRGWSVLMELHNGNFHPLIWWYGRLFRLEDAPRILAEKHYSKYAGKRTKVYEWTLLKSYLKMELEELDKEFKMVNYPRLKPVGFHRDEQHGIQFHKV